MNTINEIFKKYNWPTRISDDSDLLGIEREFRSELPEDYKEFISNYAGCEIQMGEEYIKLWDKDNLLSLNQKYEIFENLLETIGIGDNGSGELIAIEKRNDGGLRIILTPFIDLDKQNHIEIGKSFTDFLVKLDKGEKWFKDIEKDS